MTACDFTVALFCRVDDAMPEVLKHPLSKLHPSEVVAKLSPLVCSKPCEARAPALSTVGCTRN